MVLTARDPADVPPRDFRLRDFLSLDTPEGYRAELIDGEIVVTPPPDGNHERGISRIVAQILRKSSAEMDFSEVKGLIVPSRGDAEEGRVVPDATFAPVERDLFRDAAPWMPAAGVAMVLEITSSRAGVDRDAKRHAYAGARIPLYLLADRQSRKVTLFSEPLRDDYTRTVTASFGDELALPKPFSFTLDTSALAS